MRRTGWAIIFAVCLICGCKNYEQTQEQSSLKIGWAECNITPPMDCGKKIPLVGQYYVREAKSVQHDLKFTVCVMKQEDQVAILGSLDLVGGASQMRDEVCRRLSEKIPEFRPENVLFSVIHTHSAPSMRNFNNEELLNNWVKKNPGFLNAKEYMDMIIEPIVDACERAWNQASPGKVCRAFGNARIGHSRLTLYRDGTCEMYGDATRDDFIGMLGGEDSGVEMLLTEDMSGKKTGLFVNAACPAQVSEILDVMSSDFAGALREKLQKEYGDDFHVIYQYGHGGDQSPRDLTRAGSKADGFDGWHMDAVEAISDRLFTCVTEALPKAVECESVLKHSCLNISLPLRRVTPADVAKAKESNAKLLAGTSAEGLWNDYLEDVALHQKDESRLPYDSKLHPYSLMDVNNAIIERGELQKTQSEVEIESHIVRIGDVAFVSSPYELYLRYGQIIKARSAAKQTFILSRCADVGYLPTEESENAIGYSGGVNCGDTGHEGGYILCETVLKEIKDQFNTSGSDSF